MFPFQEGDRKPPPKCILHLVTSFWNGLSEKFIQWRKLTNISSARRPSSTTSLKIHTDDMCPENDVNMALDLYSLPLKTHNPSLITSEIPGKFQYLGIPQNTWLIFLKTVKVIKKKKKGKKFLRNDLSQEESKKIQCGIWDGILKQKRTSGTTKEIWINHKLYLTIMYQYSFIKGKDTTLTHHVIYRGDWVQDTWELSVLPYRFSVNIKVF